MGRADVENVYFNSSVLIQTTKATNLLYTNGWTEREAENTSKGGYWLVSALTDMVFLYSFRLWNQPSIAIANSKDVSKCE